MGIAQLAHLVDVLDAVTRLKEALPKISTVRPNPPPDVEIIGFNAYAAGKLSVPRGSARCCFGLLLPLFAMLVAGCAVTADERTGGTPQTSPTRVELLETYWRLAEIDGSPVVIHAGTREPHIMLRREGGRVTGFAGCNSLTGSYKQSADSLRFGPLAMTRMACVAADAMAREAAFTKALQDTASQRIVGNTLELRDAAGTIRIRFQARPLP